VRPCVLRIGRKGIIPSQRKEGGMERERERGGENCSVRFGGKEFHQGGGEKGKKRKERSEEGKDGG